jgi:flagellar basal-body rod protein FlgF
MIRGLYTAASGMISGLRMQATVAENLANMSTPGFKGERSGLQEFSGVLARRQGQAAVPLPMGMNSVLGRVGTGAYVDSRETVLKEGSERKTDLPLDVMIRGEGFFAIQTDDGVRYTRDGRFGRDATNTLVSADGFPVLDAAGNTITVTSDDVRMLPTGEILQTTSQTVTLPDGSQAIEVTETEVGRLSAVLLKQEDLVRAGGSRFDLAPGGTPTAADLGTTTVFIQGSLEGTNVDIADTSTQMMSLARAYQSSQQVFTTLNETLQLAVREIGKVG